MFEKPVDNRAREQQRRHIDQGLCDMLQIVINVLHKERL